MQHVPIFFFLEGEEKWGSLWGSEVYLRVEFQFLLRKQDGVGGVYETGASGVAGGLSF